MIMMLFQVRLGTSVMLVDRSSFNGAFKKTAPPTFDGFAFQGDVQRLDFFAQPIILVTP